ncbi:hypothetical protein G9C85_07820 [Halorubellus sp. JP-L1]|uniref:helix-turn-helix transcriptional regulator n=1 Tax=Halorubellus sp. JP-L1 TaxID=2715753 RepID=UPI00140C043A|nr:hypothetical protein [Halorubellus sp. JP-L1]NHN41544.1 hypothetical protein [Halorubellus sp. JP-L1]
MGVFDVVFASSVRQTVLLELRDRPRQRRALLDDVDASKSAVYDALNELRDRDLLREGRTRRWETTCLGDLVADYVADRRRTDDVLSAHASYWRDHDASVLPEPFRASLGALAGAERVSSSSSSETESLPAASSVVDVVERADRVALATPVYHDRYATALERAARSADVRFALAPAVIETAAGRADANWNADGLGVRVADPGCTVLATDEAMVLSLPREDSSHDLAEALLARTDRARAWGDRLFESVWREATPLRALESLPRP